MGELEPDDSRDVTNTPHTAPGEPPRTGPREDQARDRASQPQQEEGALAQDLATEGDSPEHPDRFSGAAAGEEPAKGDRWHQKAQDAAPDGK